MNGVGPWWFPEIWRRKLTQISELFFEEAAWNKHDVGYNQGSPDRATCDRLFFQAMLRDASRTTTITRVWACVGLATFFWIMVRLFGWLSYKHR